MFGVMSGLESFKEVFCFPFNDHHIFSPISTKTANPKINDDSKKGPYE